MPVIRHARQSMNPYLDEWAHTLAPIWTGVSCARLTVPTSGGEPYPVLDSQHHTTTISELWLRPVSFPLEHLPGEYVTLEDRDHELPRRSHSIANAPRADELISLLVTRVPDGQRIAWVHERVGVGGEVDGIRADGGRVSKANRSETATPAHQGTVIHGLEHWSSSPKGPIRR